MIPGTPQLAAVLAQIDTTAGGYVLVGVVSAICTLLAASVPSYLAYRARRQSQATAAKEHAAKDLLTRDKVDRSAYVELQKSYAELAETYRSDANLSRQEFVKERAERIAMRDKWLEAQRRCDEIEEKHREVERDRDEAVERVVSLERKVGDLTSENRSLWRTVEELRRGQYGGQTK